MAVGEDDATRRRNRSGLVRDIELLELLADEDVEGGRLAGMGVRELAAASGRDKAVVSRTMATLAEAGLVERDPASRRYRLGGRLFALAARTEEAALARRARPWLRRLAAGTGETSHLCVLRAGAVVTLASEVGHAAGRTQTWEGVSTAAWLTPSGRVLLSGYDGPSLEAWFAAHGSSEPLPRARRRRVGPEGWLLARKQPVGLDALRIELDRVRREGHGISRGELEDGVVALSVPVRSFTGEVVAALNTSGPASRETALRSWSPLLREAARSLSSPPS